MSALRRVAILLCLVAGAGAAAAQQIDVRQMHGMSRPEPKLPAGTVTVRVIRGSLAKRAVDVEVSLGTQKAKTDAEGRARFDGLAPGTTDLVARATVDGIDLESQSFTLPSDTGIAMLLTTPPSAADLPKDSPDDGPPADAPAGMPDPGQAHGVAIPTDTVPLRSLQVTLLRNGWGSAAVNHWIDLIGVDSKGTYTRQRVVTDSKGRVVFKNLERRFAYYVLAMVDGKEVVSGAVVLAPDGGQMMVLTAARADPGMVPDQVVASDQAPAGGLLVGVFMNDQTPASNVDAGLYTIGEGGRKQLGATVTSQEGRLTWTSLSQADDQIYTIEARREGTVFRSRPFHLVPGALGSAMVMVVNDTVLVAIHAGAELDDSFLRFQAEYTIANVTGAPIDFGEKGLILPLPRGFAGASVAPDKASLIKVVDGKGLAWRGSLAPGQESVQLNFAMPVEDGEVALRWAAPLGMVQWLIAVDQLPELTVEAPPSARREPVNTGDGRTFLRLSGEGIERGGHLDVTFRGLPRPPPGFKQRRTIAVVLASLLLVGGILIAMLAAYGVGGRTARRRVQLDHDIERLYVQLTTLTRRHKLGELDERSYQRARKDKQAELERALRELDQLIDEVAA